MSDTIQVVSVDEVLAYLGIDYPDETVIKNIERTIKVADMYLKGAIGKDYPVEDPRAKELALVVIADLYDNRGLISTVTGNVRRLVEDFSLQLRCELKEAVENE